MSLLYPYNSKYNGTSIDQKRLVRKDMDVNLFVFVVIEHYKSNQNNISHLLMGGRIVFLVVVRLLIFNVFNFLSLIGCTLPNIK